MPNEKDVELMIDGAGLSKVFNDFWGRPKTNALKNVAITVPAGATFGLLGPNGAGKSTLIKILLGHLYPTSGRISVLGKNPRDTEIKQRMGYLPERTSFYSTLTANETLFFFGSLLGLPRELSSKRIAQLLKMVGLEHVADRYVGEFSHGMRKRLALAQSLLNDPDLLLLDEPTAGLDPIGCREIKDIILTLGRRGKTILMTTHLLSDVQDVCDTIMILYAGQVQSEGSIDELLIKKDEILIKASNVREETAKRAGEVIRSENKDSNVEITHPARTLEEFFLSVIKEANRSGQESTGAAIGSGVADYLSAGLDSQSLKDLTRKKTPEKKQKDKNIKSEVLKDLTPEIKKADVKTEEKQIDSDMLASMTKKDRS